MNIHLVRDRTKRPFLRHAIEMTIAMMGGMVVLGAAFRELHLLLFGSGYAAAWRDHVVLAAFGMAFNMTVPMVLWMRYRGHSWERGGEMAAAMSLPVLPLLVLYWLDAIPERGVLGLQMMLMVPAMLLLMLYRKEEYGAPHPGRAPGRRRWFAVPGSLPSPGSPTSTMEADVEAEAVRLQPSYVAERTTAARQ